MPRQNAVVRTPRTPRNRAVASGSSGIATKIATRAAMDALSNISPTVGNAVRAANTVYKTYRMFRPSKKGRSAKFGTLDVGTYAGRFKRGGLNESYYTQFAKYGVTGTIEQGGQLSDTHCVYIGHTTCAVRTMGLSAIQAMIRKLFQLAKLDVQKLIEAIPIVSPAPWQIQITTVNPVTNELSSLTYNFTNTSTIVSLGEDVWGLMFDTIVKGGLKFKEVQLIDGNGAPQARYDLYGAKITYFCSSALKVQNSSFISVAGQEDDDSALNVNNVPLVGKYYSGIGAGMYWRGNANNWTYAASKDPVSASTYDFNGEVNHGLIATKSGTSTELREPPVAKLFQNVKKTAGQLLQPGNIKKDILNYKCTKYFNKFFEDLRLPSDTITPITKLATRCYAGKFSVIGLEKQIYSSNDNINVRAEVNYKYGCMINLGPRRPSTANVVVNAPVDDLSSLV